MGTRLTKGVCALAVGLLMMSGGAVSAGPGGSPLDAPTVDPSKASPGDTVTISGEDCLASVMVKVADWAPATTTGNASGFWSVKVTVPTGATSGDKTVAATCDKYSAATEYPKATLTVVAEDTPDSDEAKVTLDSSTVVAGDAVTVNFSGFGPEEDISGTLFSEPVKLGKVKSDATGSGSGTFTIPKTVAPGVHKLELKGLTTERVASTNVTVTEQAITTTTTAPTSTPTTIGSTPPGPDSENLAYTGSTTVPLGVFAMALGLLGVGLLALRRRRIA